MLVRIWCGALTLLGLVTTSCDENRGIAELPNDAGGPPASADSGPPACRIVAGPLADAGTGDAAALCGDVTRTILGEVCTGGICHHDGKTPAAGLDLRSPCVADRLVGVSSTCNGRLLVDPSAPDRSFILEKLTAAKPECGGQTMPYANHLPAGELECVRRWVYAIASSASR